MVNSGYESRGQNASAPLAQPETTALTVKTDLGPSKQVINPNQSETVTAVESLGSSCYSTNLKKVNDTSNMVNGNSPTPTTVNHNDGFQHVSSSSGKNSDRSLKPPEVKIQRSRCSMAPNENSGGCQISNSAATHAYSQPHSTNSTNSNSSGSHYFPRRSQTSAQIMKDASIVIGVCSALYSFTGE